MIQYAQSNQMPIPSGTHSPPWLRILFSCFTKERTRVSLCAWGVFSLVEYNSFRCTGRRGVEEETKCKYNSKMWTRKQRKTKSTFVTVALRFHNLKKNSCVCCDAGVGNPARDFRPGSRFRHRCTNLLNFLVLCFSVFVLRFRYGAFWFSKFDEFLLF